MEFSSLRRLRFLANLTDDRVDDMVINNDLKCTICNLPAAPFRSSSLPSVMPSVNSIPVSRIGQSNRVMSHFVHVWAQHNSGGTESLGTVAASYSKDYAPLGGNIFVGGSRGVFSFCVPVAYTLKIEYFCAYSIPFLRIPPSDYTAQLFPRECTRETARNSGGAPPPRDASQEHQYLHKP